VDNPAVLHYFLFVPAHRFFSGCDIFPPWALGGNKKAQISMEGRQRKAEIRLKNS
jgi:hypothetical protein